MAKLDVRTLTRAADEALEVVENPLHRQILENYRRHAILETTGNFDDIFTAEMTVDHPVYQIHAGGQLQVVEGRDAVMTLYRGIAAAGTTVMVLEDEQIAVADWGFASESIFNTYTPGRSVPDGNPEKFYIMRYALAMMWPYDGDGRMIGEHTYSGGVHEFREIPEEEFITVDEAREVLLPRLRPLPAFQQA
jgi:hypothetical protein